MLHKEIDLDFSVREGLADYLNSSGSPDMTLDESAFLSSMIKLKGPSKVVELGVSAGGTTTIILESLRQNNKPFEMYSIDIQTFFNKGKNQQIGYLAEKYIRDKKIINHQFILGKIIPEVIESIGFDIDLVILDTNHTLPGELLDFLIIYPFLSKDALVLLHDTGLNLINNNNSFATKLLFDVVEGEKYALSTDESKIPNISGFMLNTKTKNSLVNLFSALTINWNYNLDDKFKIYHIIISKYYSGLYANYFHKVNEIQQNLLKIIYITPNGKVSAFFLKSLRLFIKQGPIYLFKKISSLIFKRR